MILENISRTGQGLNSTLPGDSRRFDALLNYPITVIFTRSVIEQLTKEAKNYSPSIEIFGVLNSRRDISLLTITDQFFLHVGKGLRRDPAKMEFEVQVDPASCHRTPGKDRSTHTATEIISRFKVEFHLTKLAKENGRGSTEIRKFSFDDHFKAKQEERLILTMDYIGENWQFIAQQVGQI